MQSLVQYQEPLTESAIAHNLACFVFSNGQNPVKRKFTMDEMVPLMGCWAALCSLPVELEISRHYSSYSVQYVEVRFANFVKVFRYC